MSYNYSNFDQFAIKSDVERYFYGGWYCFVILCSLLGDSTILIASIKYNAFNLHKTVVAFIQHIAVIDLMNALLSTLPIAVSIFFNSGGSNKILNYLRFYLLYFVNALSALLIAAMSLGKLLLLKYPLRTRSWSEVHVHKVCAALWLLPLCNVTMHVLLGKDDIFFDYGVYTVSYKYSASIWKILLPVMTVIVLLVPNVIIIVSNVLLLNEARKLVRGTDESLRWHGIMTVFLTASVYTVSYLPITVYFIVKPSLKPEQGPGPLFFFYRIAICLMSFNILANFFVYSLTVNGFRSFLQTKFRKAVSFLSNKIPSAGINILQKL